MFEFFRQLLRRPPDAGAERSPEPRSESQEADDFSRLDSEIPLKDSPKGAHAFVRREALLNRAERVGGYEFSLSTGLQTRTSLSGEAARHAYDAALLSRLAAHGVTSLLGHRLAFVPISVASLDSPLIDRLPPRNTVLVLDMTESEDWQRLRPRLAELEERGFALGLRHAEDAEATHPLLEEAALILIDVTAFNGLDLRTLSRRLKRPRPNGRPGAWLVAQNVQSQDDYRFCVKAGYDLFQGPFISRREDLHPVAGATNHLAVMRIVDMLLREESFAAVGEQLKNEPTLSYKLLRYINSAAMGLQHPIDNLTEALVLLGRVKLARWTSLLLFDFANPGYAERLLAERALARGRTLELLAGKGRIPDDAPHLFLIGLFSLLDRVLGQPLAELLEKAVLPEVVRRALLGTAPHYADALALVVAGEADSGVPPERLEQALGACGIDDACFAQAAREALAWAGQIEAGVPAGEGEEGG